MIERARQAEVLPLEESATGCPVDPAWSPAPCSQPEEQAWERLFQVRERGPAYLVTVLFHPETCAARTLYATYITERDTLPRVPSSIRQEAEEFTKRLRAATQQHLQRVP